MKPKLLTRIIKNNKFKKLRNLTIKASSYPDILSNFNSIQKTIHHDGIKLGYDIAAYPRHMEEMKRHYDDCDNYTADEALNDEFVHVLPNVNIELEEKLNKISSLSRFALGGYASFSTYDKSCIIEIKSNNNNNNKNNNNNNNSNNDLPSLKQKINELNFESMIPYCSVSSYGDIVNQETKVDSNIRHAYECNPGLI